MTTYSRQRLPARPRQACDVRFDEVDIMGNFCQGQDGTNDKSPSRKRPKIKKKGRKKNVQAIPEVSPLMFHEESLSPGKACKDISKCHKKSSMVTSKKNIRLWDCAKTRMTDDEPREMSSASTESFAFEIESCSSRKRTLYTDKAFNGKKHNYFTREKKSNEKKSSRDIKANEENEDNKKSSVMFGSKKNFQEDQRKVKDAADNGEQEPYLSDQSSIELPRDTSVIPLSILRKGSPRSPIVLSDKDNSLGLQSGSEDLGWVSVSYPHNLVYKEAKLAFETRMLRRLNLSTLTYQPIPMDQKPPHFHNSSLKKDKKDISKASFPNFISPITHKQGKTKTTYLKEKASASQTFKDDPKSQKQVHKCSTLLLTPDSKTKQLDSVGLSAIPSRTLTSNEKKDSQEMKISDSMSQEDELRASTPKNAFVPCRLSLSPVRMPSWSTDDGLQVVQSIEVNTSEILVPSLMEPSIYQETQHPFRKDTQHPSVAENNRDCPSDIDRDAVCPTTCLKAPEMPEIESKSTKCQVRNKQALGEGKAPEAVSPEFNLVSDNEHACANKLNKGTLSKTKLLGVGHKSLQANTNAHQEHFSGIDEGSCHSENKKMQRRTVHLKPSGMDLEGNDNSTSDKGISVSKQKTIVPKEMVNGRMETVKNVILAHSKKSRFQCSKEGMSKQMENMDVAQVVDQEKEQYCDANVCHKKNSPAIPVDKYYNEIMPTEIGETERKVTYCEQNLTIPICFICKLCMMESINDQCLSGDSDAVARE